MSKPESSPNPQAADADGNRLANEAALRQSEAFNRSLIESSRDCLKLLTLDGRLLWMNNAGQKLLCIEDLNQVLGKSWIDFWAAEEDREAAKQAVAAAAAGGSGRFVAMYRVCGQERWFDVLLSPIRGADGRPEKLLAASRDITERRQAQQRLQRSEADLREREAVLSTVTHEARVGLVMVDQQRRYLFANQPFADMLGLPSADLVGKRVPDVLPHLYPQIQPKLDRALAGEKVTYELHLPQHPKSGEERFYEVIYQPRLQETASPYVITVLIDVTERKRTEQGLENLVAERTAALRDTVAELEAFSYTIAHDMRAPLRAMQGFSAMLIAEYGQQLTARPKELLERIVASASRLDHLIRDVLNYSKVARAEFPTEPVDTQALLEEILDTYPNLRPEVADVTLANHLPRVLANRAALTQVFSNLLGNAVKFVAPGTRPRVTISSEPVPPSGPNGPPATPCTRLCFEDNGIGIEPEQISKLFHMFHRAHRPEQYEGTGMGLAIVRKAVERMGGRAGVESQPGQGSRFWVELPLATDGK